MISDNNRCPRDCAERSATCHSTCERHARFIKENEARRAASRGQNVFTDALTKRINKYDRK